jgi:malate synthase
MSDRVEEIRRMHQFRKRPQTHGFDWLDIANSDIDYLLTEITTLRQQVAELEAAEKRYFDVFRRISEAHGISSPLVLIGKAINDDENYAEILARIVEEKQSKALAGDTTCEHGKGKTDYCEPCGRINGGG